jgi:hypothetical protein
LREQTATKELVKLLGRASDFRWKGWQRDRTGEHAAATRRLAAVNEMKLILHETSTWNNVKPLAEGFGTYSGYIRMDSGAK